MIEMPVLIIKKNVIVQKGSLFLIVRIKSGKAILIFSFTRKKGLLK